MGTSLCKAAVDLKIINGFEDGTFRAGEPVTYEQAVKMLVCAVGYEVVARSEYNKIIATNPNATWSAGYIAAANKHGITKGVITAKISEPAARGVVAVLTSNGLDVPEIKENEDGTFEKVDPEEETNKNVQEIKGVVSGTYYTGLDAASVDIAQNEIMIGTGEDKETYELSAELRKSINFEDLIGKNVVAYYDTIDRQITSVVARNNTSTIIKEQDIISINGDTVRYYTDENRRNTDSISLSGYTKIYNGKYYPAADLANDFRNGQIELIEGGGQKVAKITSYQVFVVNSKSFTSTEERIYFKDNKEYKPGEAFYDFPAATSSKPEIYQNGAKKEFSSSLFSEWTVINLLESPNVGGNKVNRMYLTSGKKSGKITEGLDEERIVQLDGKEIYLTRDYAESSDKVTFELNSTYSYVLDYTGQIAAVDKKAAASNTVYSYGYLVGADSDDGLVRLVLKDGTDSTVNMKKNVKIDGVSTDKKDVETKLTTIAALIGNTGCYQPVKYNITNSELVALDTVADSTGTQLATAVGSNSDDTFVYNGKEDSVTATTSKVTVGGNTYNFTSSTKVIYVPSDKSAVGDYSVMSPSTAFAVGTNRKIEVLGADPSDRIKNATMVLMYGTDPAYTTNGKTPYMIVTGKKVTGGKDIIEGYQEGSDTITTLTISEEKFKAIGTNHVNSDAVGKGDVIRYIGTTGNVIAIEMVYDADGSGKLYAAGENGDYMYFKSHTSGIGEVHIKYTEAVQVDEEEKKMHVTTKVGETDEDIITNNLLEYKIDSSTVVYRIEGNDIKADKGIFENISTEKGSSSEVIMITRSSSTSSTPTAKAIYIVK